MSHARILALDLGTHCGWAHQSGEGIRMSGMQRFENGRFDGAGMRFVRFRRWLTEMKGEGLDAVYFEEVRAIAIPGRSAGLQAAQVYGGFFAILSAWCEHHAIPYEGIPLATIKRFATGKGNADKAAMIAAARALGCNTRDDNEADAFLLLRLAVQTHDGESITLALSPGPVERPRTPETGPPF
jgi:hypothetical protein